MLPTSWQRVEGSQRLEDHGIKVEHVYEVGHGTRGCSGMSPLSPVWCHPLCWAPSHRPPAAPQQRPRHRQRGHPEPLHPSPAGRPRPALPAGAGHRRGHQLLAPPRPQPRPGTGLRDRCPPAGARTCQGGACHPCVPFQLEIPRPTAAAPGNRSQQRERREAEPASGAGLGDLVRVVRG